jgi:hypothetical protein
MALAMRQSRGLGVDRGASMIDRRNRCSALLATALVAATMAMIWSVDRAMAGGDDASAATLPEGAIEVGEGRYQLPMGRDDDGCMMYQLQAPGQMVAQAISYRRADGSFTYDRREAACGEDEPKP